MDRVLILLNRAKEVLQRKELPIHLESVSAVASSIEQEEVVGVTPVVTNPQPERVITTSLINSSRGTVTLKPAETDVILVGLSEYRNPDWKLNGPINDAHLMHTVLQTHCKIPAINFSTLYNHNATKRNVLDLIKRTASPNRYLIVYWSGHGSQVYSESEPDHKEEVLITFDHNWADPLIDDEIYMAMQGAKQGLLILDCCHAQGMSKGEFNVKSIVAPAKVPNLRHYKVVSTGNISEIASCLSHEVSLERPFGATWHGVFTYYLCEILKKNPYISFTELQNELDKVVTTQHPIITAPLQTSLFTLAA